jgi:hypothetical protein
MPHKSCKNSDLKLFAPYLPQAHKQGIGTRAAAHLLVNIDPTPKWMKAI